jgi:hypothetical protein
MYNLRKTQEKTLATHGALIPFDEFVRYHADFRKGR